MAKSDKNKGCCNVEAVVSFDSRGQLVLPKDLRAKYDLKEGDKFAIVSCNNDDGSLCCLSLIKTDALQGMIKNFLGPTFKDILSS